MSTHICFHGVKEIYQYFGFTKGTLISSYFISDFFTFIHHKSTTNRIDNLAFHFYSLTIEIKHEKNMLLKLDFPTSQL